MQQKQQILFAIIFIVFAIVIYEYNTQSYSSTIVEETGDIIVAFCDINNCSNDLSKLISSSNEAKCAFYNQKDETLKNNFEKINSTTLIYAKNYEDFGKPIETKGLMHHKFCVFDDEIITTGSYNPGESSKRDNQIIITSKALSENYKQEIFFLETSKETKTPHTKIMFNNRTIKNYFCPRDSCKEKILYELENAEESIIFMTFTFTDKDIASEILERNSTGVNVKGIIEDFQNKKEWVYPMFENNSVILATTITQHNKVFIIDNKTLITGSFNPTNAANTINNENIIILEEPEIVAKYLDYFDYVYSLETLAKTI
ncbi:hypothetical protein COV13_04255 [Candidatus Woesearchaeota archaeon CG10_big_fil_rev_8_21_14_0_10_32_9]|nr:MAG: hypothetical protein COV13_04255 [Candidatus Woesearchaeota archaeon CG10_big_fil_rev_8_21_14_0_10_32_9]